MNMTQISGSANRGWRLPPVLSSISIGLLCLTLLAGQVTAQDLDPRAYARVPVDGTFFVGGFTLSHGGILTDPTLPITDITATVETPSIGVARSFSLFGRTAQAFGVLPYSWAQLSGNVLGEGAGTARVGVSDMRIRFSVLVHGAPAASMLEIAKAPRGRILGTSLSIGAPTGHYEADKLVNLGTHRWSFKPEFAVSQPVGERWLVDAYAGLWLYTANDSYYPGHVLRAQAPLGAFQAHVSYNFQRQLWAAFDATYYVGGHTEIQGVPNDDGQSNSRVGATVNLPIGQWHSLKLSASRGAFIRYGANFSALSVAWQTAWLSPSKPTK
jgi:hypothetical protein